MMDTQPQRITVRKGFSVWIAECHGCGEHAERRHPKTASKWASRHYDTCESR